MSDVLESRPERMPSGPVRRAAAWVLRQEGLTLRAIGVRLGVSAERVRQDVAKHERLRRRREYRLDDEMTAAEIEADIAKALGAADAPHA
jgi:protein involved in polysaccharide export with SLBB domain